VSGSEGTREDLIRDLEVRAQWRTRRAEQHPGDDRDVRSAKALAEAARDVATMPGDDPRLVRLADFYAAAGDDAVATYLEAQNGIMSHHGYDSADATTDGLLAALCYAADEALPGGV
jgi:hypothetical protein